MNPAAVVIACLVVLLANEPEIRNAAEVNDLEHFEQWFAHPAQQQKLVGALLELRGDGR